MALKRKWTKTPRKNRLWMWATLLFLAISIVVTIIATYRIQTYGSLAAVRPPCVSHNDCPANWGYCLGGECWSYNTDPRLGSACQQSSDCGNNVISCVDGICQRDVGEVGGCSESQDCVDQYRVSKPGVWACVNSQCLRLGFRPEGDDTYWTREGLKPYGSWAGCFDITDCGPNATCDEYACIYKTNRNPCHSLAECGSYAPDANQRYVCVDANSKLITTYDGSEHGTCVAWDVCDPRLITCGVGKHCIPRNTTYQRVGNCAPDAGTTGNKDQPPAGWTTPCPTGTTLIERCSDTTDWQRVRYCINPQQPNTLLNIVRWNQWYGAQGQWCAIEGEIWTQVNYDKQFTFGNPNMPQVPQPQSTPPPGFYDGSTCAISGTRAVRCSNTYPDQLISYCSSDLDDPTKSAIRWDNWVGPNGETCTIKGVVVPDPSTWSAANSSNPWLEGRFTINRSTTQGAPKGDKSNFSNSSTFGTTNTSGVSGIVGTIMNLFQGMMTNNQNTTSFTSSRTQETSAPTETDRTSTPVIDMVKLILDYYGSKDQAQLKQADINGDGVIDLLDMRALINLYRNQ